MLAGPGGGGNFTLLWAGEVTPQKKIVWRMEAGEGREIHTIQPIGLDRCLVADNGNTILCSRANGEKTQLVEITPDKKVVWALRDWKHLGQATAIQVLDDPGIPEQPGDLRP